MQIGEWFSPDGYDEQARIQFDQGDVLVYSNNSSHFLVAVEWLESMTDGESTTKVELIGLFSYGEKFLAPWKAALEFAMEWAINHTEEP